MGSTTILSVKSSGEGKKIVLLIGGPHEGKSALEARLKGKTLVTGAEGMVNRPGTWYGIKYDMGPAVTVSNEVKETSLANVENYEFVKVQVEKDYMRKVKDVLNSHGKNVAVVLFVCDSFLFTRSKLFMNFDKILQISGEIDNSLNESGGVVGRKHIVFTRGDTDKMQEITKNEEYNYDRLCKKVFKSFVLGSKAYKKTTVTEDVMDQLGEKYGFDVHNPINKVGADKMLESINKTIHGNKEEGLDAPDGSQYVLRKEFKEKVFPEVKKELAEQIMFLVKKKVAKAIISYSSLEFKDVKIDDLKDKEKCDYVNGYMNALLPERLALCFQAFRNVTTQGRKGRAGNEVFAVIESNDTKKIISDHLIQAMKENNIESYFKNDTNALDYEIGKMKADLHEIAGKAIASFNKEFQLSLDNAKDDEQDLLNNLKVLNTGKDALANIFLRNGFVKLNIRDKVKSEVEKISQPQLDINSSGLDQIAKAKQDWEDSLKKIKTEYEQEAENGVHGMVEEYKQLVENFDEVALENDRDFLVNFYKNRFLIKFTELTDEVHDRIEELDGKIKELDDDKKKRDLLEKEWNKEYAEVLNNISDILEKYVKGELNLDENQTLPEQGSTVQKLEEAKTIIDEAREPMEQKITATLLNFTGKIDDDKFQNGEQLLFKQIEEEIEKKAKTYENYLVAARARDEKEKKGKGKALYYVGGFVVFASVAVYLIWMNLFKKGEEGKKDQEKEEGNKDTSDKIESEKVVVGENTVFPSPSSISS